MRTQKDVTVPRLSQLHAGVGVNIVLKADQRSGRLTPGKVSDILTNGDHPRGVKVRLKDGRIGRVQSLAEASDSERTMQETSLVSARLGQRDKTSDQDCGNHMSIGSITRGKGIMIQEHHRKDPHPLVSRSLADYIKNPSRPKQNPISRESIQGNTMQAQFEKEFPNIDTALIAAIIADHDEPESAKAVLTSLS